LIRIALSEGQQAKLRSKGIEKGGLNGGGGWQIMAALQGYRRSILGRPGSSRVHSTFSWLAKSGLQSSGSDRSWADDLTESQNRGDAGE